MALVKALRVAIFHHQGGILRLLLTVDGDEGRSKWANTNLDGTHLFHYCAAFCYPATVSILLQAWAGETARELGGRIALELIRVISDGRFRLIGGRKSPLAGCRSVSQRTELDPRRGPLMKKRVTVVAVMATPMLVLLVRALLPLFSRLRNRRSPPMLWVSTSSGQRKPVVETSSSGLSAGERYDILVCE